MTTGIEIAKEMGRDASEGGLANQFLERIAERIGGRASVTAVFGEPIERGDLTVVPVARVRWGFGGGSGTAGPETQASGSGGGGGVAADAIGYIEIRSGEATFRRIGTGFAESRLRARIWADRRDRNPRAGPPQPALSGCALGRGRRSAWERDGARTYR